MCGISGIINGNIDTLIEKQRHRGPDETGKTLASAEYDLWLGHNRLSIIDLSENGNQPMESHQYVLTFNGEIYNYKELWNSLDYQNEDWELPGGDSKALLFHIQRFGLSQTLKDVNGMYAFGLFDKLYNKLHL